jgi:hypothetical protein
VRLDLEKDDVDLREKGGQFILEVESLSRVIGTVTRPPGR